jgi:hypothetical protein
MTIEGISGVVVVVIHLHGLLKRELSNAFVELETNNLKL